MATAVGEIVKGKVVSITKFGAFVQLKSGETGLCHISEVSASYVKSVEDHLSVGDEVTVKVISFDKGKMSVSIKEAQAQPDPLKTPSQKKPSEKVKTEYHADRSKDSYERPKGRGNDFESMLSQFIKTSDDNLKGVKKSSKSRRGNGHQSGRE
ncbi:MULTISPECIES: S1 RNA-binding domain-containing protein [unclassified Fusibacter]|uniref:S1 RNA-binding domain-containing protein n=1 Tax=unclassified Fusibacter TaxID=2624464 RepID=UPI0010110F66|nr:S1 RNA-binding domain-containing protein [Fusibacter sp. A1]MCK8059528.1 S1 RNA-binding domain-containing protein [Fusibacter sp. A2]NPE21008.1 S1 RNA-binding domain-containing protein [Fusibacter sp. A1]RXV62282.1 S1 RNA-binding domain-containing protein [Fusibacter sp. A1]